VRTMSTQQVVAATGITYRNLDHWVRRGVLLPDEDQARPGSGTARVWDPKEIALARLTASLRDLHAPIDVVRCAADRLRRVPLRQWAGAVSVSPNGEVELGTVPRHWPGGWTVRLEPCAAPLLAVAS
jgi:DNA-binding transcriptional MerR regulator